MKLLHSIFDGQRVIKIGIITAAVLLISGCMPRGETKTLEEVYKLSKGRFESMKGKGASPKSQAHLENIVKALDSFAAGDTSKAAAIAEDMNRLMLHTGFTSRPALGELMSQYRTMAAAADAAGQPRPEVKLLAARTYRLLAAELETTRFGIE